MAWPVKHLADDPFPALSIINLLDHPLVDCFTLATQPTRKPKCRSFCLGHHQELLNNRLDELDGTSAGLNMMVVIVSIFLNTMKRVFELILPMRNETRIFRRPGRVRCPLIVEHAVTKLIAATARLLPLAFGQKTVAGP